MAGGADRPVALVTGAARRVGLAMARALAAAGCDVIITYNRSHEEAERAAEGIRAEPGAKVDLYQLDLGDLKAVELFGASMAKGPGRLDVLVHNASIYEPTPLGELTAEQAERAYRVNALAPLLLSKHLAGRLGASAMPGGGAIVAMCDIHAMGEHGLPRKEFAAYAMSKAALAEMVRSLARELAPRVRVNGVAPGVVAFPETGHESEREMQEAYLKRVPLGRSGTPEDAAATVMWLALRATYITGQIVRLDGGRSLL